MKWVVVGISVFLFCLSEGICADLERGVVRFKDYSFNVELAQTAKQRARGLMFREYLGPDQGMLFVYQDEGVRSFWMRNTFIRLDIIWINKDKEVVFIGQDIQPCQREPCPVISPKVMAKYVLELNARTAEEIELNIGDKLEFDLEESR